MKFPNWVKKNIIARFGKISLPLTTGREYSADRDIGYFAVKNDVNTEAESIHSSCENYRSLPYDSSVLSTTVYSRLKLV